MRMSRFVVVLEYAPPRGYHWLVRGEPGDADGWAPTRSDARRRAFQHVAAHAPNRWLSDESEVEVWQ